MLFRRFLPPLLTVAAAVYAFIEFDRLTPALQSALSYAPWLLLILGLLMAVSFRRGGVFFLLLLCGGLVLTDRVLGFSDIKTLTVTALFVPLTVTLLNALKVYGVFNVRNAVLYVLLAALLVAAFWLHVNFPPAFDAHLFRDWLDARYFDWTVLPQPVYLLWLLAALFLMACAARRPGGLCWPSLVILGCCGAALQWSQHTGAVSLFASAALLTGVMELLHASWKMAYLDELTQLPGRRALNARFEALNGLYALCMVDVDHFKKLNDTHGHDCGDDVLRMVAARLNEPLHTGTAHRYGGEEFVIVLNGLDRKSAKEAMTPLLERIAQTDFVIKRSKKKSTSRKPSTLRVTVSMGLADSSQTDAGPEAVLKCADKALYRAKKKGRNQISF